VTIPIRFNLLNESALSPANTLPYETLPGGSTNPLQQAGDCANGFDFGSLNGIYAAYLRTQLYNGDLCFVPTFSALDVPTVTQATAYAKYINNTTDNPSPPNVIRYIAQENVNNSSTQFNVAHISFTPRNSEWIYDEMQGIPYASNYCSTECLPLAIASSSGPQRLCAGASATFSIPNLPAGMAVSWSTDPAGYFTPATGTGPTFTTAAAAGAQGTATVTARVGACQTLVTTTVGVGPAPVDGSYYCSSGCPSYPPTSGTIADFTIVPAGSYTLNLSRSDGGTFRAWQGIVDGNNWYTYSNNSAAVVTLGSGQRAQFTVTVDVPGCGAVTRTFTLAVYGYRLAFAPNPASTDLTVTAVDADQPTADKPSATAPPFDADLYDGQGKKIKTEKSAKGQAKFDVRDLPNGLYHLRAGKGKEAISEQVQIAH